MNKKSPEVALVRCSLGRRSRNRIGAIKFCSTEKNEWSNSRQEALRLVLDAVAELSAEALRQAAARPRLPDLGPPPWGVAGVGLDDEVRGW